MKIRVSGDLNLQRVMGNTYETWGEVELRESEMNRRLRRNSGGQMRLDHADDVMGRTVVGDNYIEAQLHLEDPEETTNIRRGHFRFSRKDGPTYVRFHYMGEYYSGLCAFEAKNDDGLRRGSIWR